MNSGLAHLVHHHIHWEWCYNLEGRRDAIRYVKPCEEHAVRLKFLGLIPPEELPRSLLLWVQKLLTARLAWFAAYNAWTAARQALGGPLEALHSAEVAVRVLERKSDAARRKVEVVADKCDAAVNRFVLTHPARLAAIHVKYWPDCPWDETLHTMFTRANKGEWY